MSMSVQYDRQSFLGPDSEQLLGVATAAVVGLCGGGSHEAQQLAHVGVGRLLLMDFDQVDESNLNRMIGSGPQDAEQARRKTDVIFDLVNRIRPGVAHPIEGKWQDSLDSLRGATVILSAVDSLQARRDLEAFARRFMIPMVDVGLDVSEFGAGGYVMSGQVIVSIPGRPCMRCMNFLTDDALADEARRYGVAGRRPQVVWGNGVLASTAVGQVVKLITGWPPNDMSLYLEYSANRGTVQPSELPRFAPASCPHFPQAEVGDPFFSLNS